jgi:LEA14-like dessication related protein
MKRALILTMLLTAGCIVLSAVTLLLSGCPSFLPRHIINPTYTLRGIVPHVAIALPLSSSAIDFDITFGVDNPNDVGLRLDRLDFDLLINDKPILTSVRADQGIQIPAHGFGEVHLRTRVAYSNIRTIFRQIADIVQGEHARYTIHGDAWYHTPLGPLRYPLTLYSH